MMANEWTPFQLMENPAPSIDELKHNFDMDHREAVEMIAWLMGGRVYRNNRYQIHIREHLAHGWPPLWHLSIKSVDRDPVHDWRDLQRIKNELIGPESEAVELYPAESRLIDTSNQYHLFALRQIGQRFPFGFHDGRAIQTNDQVKEFGAKQRDYETTKGDKGHG